MGRLGGPQRRGKGEDRAAPRLAHGRDSPAHQLDELTADGQSQTGAAMGPRQRPVGLLEPGEQPLGVVGLEPDAGVADLESVAVRRLAHADAQFDEAAIGEFHRVVEQMVQNLFQPPPVADHLGAAGGVGAKLQRQGLGLGRLRMPGDHLVQQLGQIEGRLLDLDLSGLQPAEVQNVAQHPVELGGGGRDGAKHVALVLGQVAPAQHVQQTQHAIEGGADFVAHIGQELRLGAARRLGARQRGLQRIGLALQVGDVDAKADHAAIAGPTFLDHDPAAVGQALLVTLARIVHQGDPIGQPYLLAADRVRIVATLHADPQGVDQPPALGEKIGRAVINLGIAPVPQDVAAVAVEEDHAFGQNVDGLAKPHLSLAGLPLGPFQGRAVA